MLIVLKQTKRKGKQKQRKIRYPVVFLLTIFGMKGIDSQFGESAKGVLTCRPPLTLFLYKREYFASPVVVGWVPWEAWSRRARRPCQVEG